jgi:zinc D-Ala-D-Ala carboxypeptidase
MQLSPHFSLAEFTASDTAARQGINNELPSTLLPIAQDTAAMLERIRQYLSQRAGREIPMQITSGYRCLALNAAIGSSPTSDHPKALAADWKAPEFGTPLQICRLLAPLVDVLGIGQLIHEFGTWVHTSQRVPALPINRVITISRAGTQAGIREV